MEAVLGQRTEPRTDRSRFYVFMAGVFLLIAFSGFTPSYWAPLARGHSHFPPILHIHGFLLFSWTLFYFLQTALVAAGRTPSHRAWGLFGISLFSVIVCSIIAAKISLMHLDVAAGFAAASRRFAAVPLLALPFMIGFFAFAIANVRRPEIHKRAMFVLMAAMMTPAIARIFLFALAPAASRDMGPPPLWVALPPSCVSLVLIGIGMIHDWRTRGRAHPVYVYGICLLIASNLLTVWIGGTPAWASFAESLEHIAG